MNECLPRLALLIDADNVNLQIVPRVLDRLTGNWDVSYRRAYGLNLLTRQEILRKYSIVPIEVLHNTPGKNSTDLTLAIDAMEELCLGPSEAICIVSGDSDFTRLVQRIREKGKRTIVFGTVTSADALRKACNEFHEIESLQVPQNTRGRKTPRKKPAPIAPKTPQPENEATVRNGLHQVFREFRTTSEAVSLE